ncbi:Rho GTPase activation protein [Sporodiniella umbellata]|nr:Rho GTPase activation protein [Sporodiniella umbellata]
MKVDSARDIQIYTLQYQANCNTLPTPVRYENFYFEGKCREVLFGCSLDAYAIEHNRTIPLIVIKCVEAIERNGGLQKEGIYRISGRQSNIEQLKHMFEMDEDKVVLDSKMDVFTISTLLKMFIRELKGPLFRFNVESRLTYSKNMPQNQRFGILESKLSSLSLAHRNTLRYLTSHLANVNANNQVNKMNIQNLAVIFTPVIFHDFNQTEEATYGDWSAEEVFEDLILYHEMLFPIAEENARKLNEASLQKALNGESPYSQHSQSNLLYLSQPPPSAVAKHLLLTQPMTAPVLSTERANESPYPPKLTTIIGHPPRRPSQPSAPPSSALLNPRASTGNLVHETTCIPVQRSTSDTIVLKQVPSVRPAVPLRRDSLRKETHVASYQPELNLDPPPLSPLSEDFKK